MDSTTLQARFGLTPAEARLTLRLATGASLRTAAAQLNIRYETARSHLKKVFKKTATSRQTELVITILRGAVNAPE